MGNITYYINFSLFPLDSFIGDLAVCCPTPSFLKSIIFLKLTGGNCVYNLVDINFKLNTKDSATFGHINLGPFFHNGLAIRLNFPRNHNHKMRWLFFSDCTKYPKREPKGSKLCPHLFSDNIASLIIKCFQFVTQLHKLIFFVYYILSKYNLSLHWHTKSTPPPLRFCTISIHSNFIFLHTLIEKGTEGNFAILKIKTICFHSWYIFFFLSKENQSFCSLY